ncbi:MAG: septum site-determining protein MinC [Anaerolineae bacterium]|nr:septum site-determining protein MinC [Anaerolineae bacterium]NUQ06765.1 septum site-determining protein MinC [Anaerolineae bacterium]
MHDQAIGIKGFRDGLLVTMEEVEEWQALVDDLAERIDGQSTFFAGARITLDVGARPVTRHELGSIKAMLDRRGLTLINVLTESKTTLDAAASLDVRGNLTTPPPAAAEPEQSSEEDGSIGVMIRKTLRGGRTVRSHGHVVVFGDVNPGAEIISGGDIIIWGRLRGIVHAGANGDESAVVCALDMMPTQLRIASYITVAPADKRHKPRPEIALIRSRQIIVEAWK